VTAERPKGADRALKRLLGEDFEQVFKKLAEGPELTEQAADRPGAVQSLTEHDFADQLHFLALEAGYEPTTKAGKLFEEARRIRHAPRTYQTLHAALLLTKAKRTRFHTFTAILIAARGAIARDQSRFANAFEIPEEALQKFEGGSTHPAWFSRERARSIASLLAISVDDWDVAVTDYSEIDPFMYPPPDRLSESWLAESWIATHPDWATPSAGLLEKLGRAWEGIGRPPSARLQELPIVAPYYQRSERGLVQRPRLPGADQLSFEADREKAKKRRHPFPEFDALLHYMQAGLAIRNWASFAEAIGTVPELVEGVRLGAVHPIWLARYLSRGIQMMAERGVRVPVSIADLLAAALRAKDPKEYVPWPDVRDRADEGWQHFLDEYARAHQKPEKALQTDEISGALKEYLRSTL
jgi:hypothetical protein